MDNTTGNKSPGSNQPGGSGMWFMNHFTNPMMRLVLRSPLHGLFSGSLALITYRGRRSGREYTIPVQYVQAGEKVYIIPGEAEQKTWWRNLRGGASVGLVLRGQNVKGMAQVLQGETDKAAIAEALIHYYQRFPAAARLQHLQPASNGTFNPDDLGRIAASIVMVRVTLD
jgi:deazaflavin-dependent oxidoreductase (nitroreductase family)